MPHYSSLMPQTLEHKTAQIGSVSIHYVEAGSGPLVVLLHGFPEFWYSWRRQIGPLAAAGFRVLAPDLRGYNLSGKPRGVAAYRPEVLTADVAALIRHVGESGAAVVGHGRGAGRRDQLVPRRLPPGTAGRGGPARPHAQPGALGRARPVPRPPPRRRAGTLGARRPRGALPGREPLAPE